MDLWNEKLKFISIKRSDQLPEWVMIEMQGELTYLHGEITEKNFIGDIHFTASGAPIFVIGFDILYGKEITLAKPIALLEKITGSEVTNGEDTQDEKETNNTEYRVKSIVKKKLVFKSRPKPIIIDVPIRH